MTLCNMSIEAGATAAIVPPDEVTFSYVAGRRFAPRGCRVAGGGVAMAHARQRSRRAVRPRRARSTSTTLTPLVTWGTRPDMVVPVDRRRARSRRQPPTSASARR